MAANISSVNQLLNLIKSAPDSIVVIMVTSDAVGGNNPNFQAELKR